MIQAAKIIGTGLATTGLIGAGSNLGGTGSNLGKRFYSTSGRKLKSDCMVNRKKIITLFIVGLLFTFPLKFLCKFLYKYGYKELCK